VGIRVCWSHVTRGVPLGEPGESYWDAWNAQSLADEPIMRLIVDGTAVKVRLDRKATLISLLVVIGVRAAGQKVLLAVKSMGGESTEAWRSVLDGRGLRRPELVIVDGGSGLDAALAALWSAVPVQRCTVHKHNLLGMTQKRGQKLETSPAVGRIAP
jgi:transposase-like protein